MSLMHRSLSDKFEWYELCLERRALKLGHSHAKPSLVSILKHMRRDAPSRIALLAQRSGMSRRRVSQIVAEGVGAGILRLVDDPDDKRVSLVTMSEDGQQMCDAEVHSIHVIEAELAQRIGRGNLQKLKELLEMDWGPAEVAAVPSAAAGAAPPAKQAVTAARPRGRRPTLATSTTPSTNHRMRMNERTPNSR
jgi:DNA-binding MarR family transcriptional regulator